MKKYLLFIFLTYLVSACLAQSYVPIPDTLVVWRQSRGGGIWPSMSFSKQQVFTTGKIQIDSFQYTELHTTGNQKNTDGTITGFTDTLFGYFRNDIPGKKVLFRYNTSDTSDKVLYDFSLNVGDSIPSSWLTYSYPNVINRIDTVWMFGEPRRRLSFFDTTFIPGSIGAIIEGVGSASGFGWELTLPLEPTWISLECFSYKDSSYTDFYQTPVYSDTTCWLYSDIKTVNTKNASLSIFPNPATYQFSVDVDMQPSQLEILNLLGEKVYTQALSRKQEAVNFNLAAGVYVARVSDGERFYVQKLMVR